LIILIATQILSMQYTVHLI